MHRILVVEANRNLRSLYKMILSREGYDVTTVSDRESALDKISDTDLLISDLDSPLVDSAKNLARYYRKKGNLKVIINTGYPLLPEQSKFYKADAVLTKTSNFDQLTSTIRTVLQ